MGLKDGVEEGSREGEATGLTDGREDGVVVGLKDGVDVGSYDGTSLGLSSGGGFARTIRWTGGWLSTRRDFRRSWLTSTTSFHLGVGIN